MTLKYMRVTKLIALSLFVFPRIIWAGCTESPATVWTPDSHSQADIEACLVDGGFGTGDTINVPAGDGSEDWDDLDIDIGCNLVGPGLASLDIGYSGSSGQMVNIDAGHGDAVRITGFTFSGNAYVFKIENSGITNTSLRFDSLYFDGTSAPFVTAGVGAVTTGVIYSNTFNNVNAINVSVTQTSGDPSETPGTSLAWFIEDNTFNMGSGNSAYHAIAANANGIYVARYNTFNITDDVASLLDAHGYCSNNRGGTYMVEIYQNTVAVSGGKDLQEFANIRGGRGTIYDNTLTGSLSGAMIAITNYRSCASYAAGSGCNQVGNTECDDTEGYPCTDQINNFYAWDNTDDGVEQTITPPNCGTQCTGDCDWVAHLTENTDYFNTELSYTPYTYPHPVRGDVTAPTFSSADISADGDTLTVDWSENLTDGGLDGGEFDLDCSVGGDDISLTYSSGDGTSQWTFTIGSTVYQNEICNLDFDGDTDEAEDDSGNDLADFSDESVTNKSGVPQAETSPTTSMSNTGTVSTSNTGTLSFDN